MTATLYTDSIINSQSPRYFITIRHRKPTTSIWTWRVYEMKRLENGRQSRKCVFTSEVHRKVSKRENSTYIRGYWAAKEFENHHNHCLILNFALDTSPRILCDYCEENDIQFCDTFDTTVTGHTL